ncbi:MAG: Yip1 family protein, partial [archaeon]|nr:Yip1 family protein [archaeon]
MSSDDELAFIAPSNTKHQPSLYTGSTLAAASARQNYGVLGPEDESNITLESDIDLFSEPVRSPSGSSASSSFGAPPPQSPAAEVAIDLNDPIKPAPVDDGKEYKFWEIEYYQKYFNVTTMDVLTRMAKSLVPYGDNFFKTIERNPDLYGAFWVPTTLIFFMAATGNFGTYLACDDPSLYSADFLKVVYGAIAIYGYVAVLPLVLWGVFKYFGIPLGLTENLCLYGYSLTVYLPIAVLAIVPSGILRWVLLGVGALMVCVCLFR